MENWKKISLLDKPVMICDGLNVEHHEQKLQEKLNRILDQQRFRQVMYPKDPEPNIPKKGGHL